MLDSFRLAAFAFILIVFSPFDGWAPPAADAGEVVVLTLDDVTINPVTAEYISRGLDAAQKKGAAAVIIQLDTPGGLLNATHRIVKSILNARIPVIVYVAPPGSRAASAGVFITYAAHLAAMAPSTHLGAAHPVTIGGGWPVFKKRKEMKRTAPDEPGGETTTPHQPQPVDAQRDRSVDDPNQRIPSPEEPSTADEARRPPSERQTAKENIPSADPMADKILNDTVAFVRSLAKTRGRNEEWAVKAVVESATLDAEDAVRLHVVDLLADDLDDLLDKIHGRTIVVRERPLTLNVKDAVIVHEPMSLRQRLLNILVDPNLAYILMILGFYGLLYEVTHPGFGIPGFLGAVFLIVAFYALQTLPTNYAALLLMALGAALFIAEAMAPGIGLLAVGGVIAMGLGSLLLFETPYAEIEVSKELVLGFTLSTAVISIVLVRAAIQAHGRKPLSGTEAMIDEIGEVMKDIPRGEEGFVLVHGELWRAVSKSDLKKHDKIKVVAVKGNLLEVEPVDKKDL